MENFVKDDRTKEDAKYKWCKRILIFTVIILSVRLWDLQIMKGNEMRRQSEQNRVRVKKVIAPRGIIYDRAGRILADTRPSFNLYITPEDIKDFNQTVDGLANLLQMDREEVIEKLKGASGFPPSFPVKIKSDISMDEVAKVEANRVYLPGVGIQIEPKRNYPYGKFMAHLLGYVSEISEEELKSNAFKGYSPGDNIGRYGIERAYEQYLRGKDGEKRVEVDALGREVRTLETIEPVAGNNIYLNIDLDVQLTLEKGFENKRGGGIVLDTKTGGVLAMVSRPAFDPNKFASGITKEDWKAIATDRFHPLQNRVIQGRYPPGSTFKMVVALKALEEGLINERTGFLCRGGFPYGNRVFKCWKKGGHGHVSVHRAIVESCDVFFYNVGLKLGVDRIHEMAQSMGLGKITGIDLPNEKEGLVPSTAWKKKVRGEAWYEGETVSVSIGQGAVWLTPIQLAQMSAFIANDGVTYKPQIVNRIIGFDGKVIKIFEPSPSTDIKIKKEHLKIIKEGMKGVVNEPSGTAYSSRIQHIVMAGKTGTAQSVGEKGRNLGDHAWFVAYAPVDNPSVAMAILAEHGGHGSTAAAPIAKQIVESVFKEKTLIKEAKLNEGR
ncbi:MAG: penicillin-binding protein 2 [Syntrophorhabdaceae bacterium]|nr:penicillin-binding protein 2 [Syntrophorhabdaceae bacterium]